MSVINIQVRRKKAANPAARIVCGNSGYKISFNFDEEWDAYPAKTARFIWGGKMADVVFTGNLCDVPVLTNTTLVAVGVYAGDLCTTTPALIACDKSILCGDGLPPDPTPEVYAQIMELLNSSVVTPESISAALGYTPANEEELVYVTPQMYGAKGDGVADDTAAFQAAVDSGKSVTLPEGRYLITGTIRLKDGVKITGSKNSVILAYAPTVFLLAPHNTLADFCIDVLSENVLSVFEANDNSTVSDLSYSRIYNIEVHHRLSSVPDMYTVCHFHTEARGMYDIIVKDCNFMCDTTGGYVARVYCSEGAWISTVTFDGCNTYNFKWHYFFANNDRDLVAGESRGHIVTNCVAQCAPDTNGFCFVTHYLTGMFNDNKTWDWGISRNCTDAPSVLSADFVYDPEIMNISNTTFISGWQMMFYDGTSFTRANRRQDVALFAGAPYKKDMIPKYIGIPSKICIRVYTHYTKVPTNSRIRFYLCDRYGVTYVSICPDKKKVYLSQPIGEDTYKIGVSADGVSYYLYRTDGSGILPNTGIMTIPRTDNGEIFGDNNVANTEYTATCWINPDENYLDAVPDGVVEYTKVLSQPPYVSDPDGNMYKITLTKGDDGQLALGYQRAWGAQQETG